MDAAAVVVEDGGGGGIAEFDEWMAADEGPGGHIIAAMGMVGVD